MKAESLKQAMDFVMGTPKVQNYIKQFEAEPPEYAIVDIGVAVTDYQQNIMRVRINFSKKTTPVDPEDVLIDVKGTYYGDFQIIHVSPVHLYP